MSVADNILMHLARVKRTGPGRWSACCPAHDSKSGSSLRICEAEDGRVLMIDHGGCSVESVLGAIGLTMKDLFPPRPGAAGARQERERMPSKAVSRPVAPLKRESLNQYGLELFRACSGLRGGIGESYLQARGCVIPPVDGDLRFHPALRHPSGYTGPALVALVTHAETREPMTLHRTWVRADGTKADCDPSRLLLGGHAKKHGVIRLWPDECVTYGLGVAEGIETALSLAHAYTPAWACIDAGNLAALPVLAGIETLTIAADHDDAGITAAEACATRWTDAGCEVFMVLPATEKSDLNDLARAA